MADRAECQDARSHDQTRSRPAGSTKLVWGCPVRRSSQRVAPNARSGAPNARFIRAQNDERVSRQLRALDYGIRRGHWPVHDGAACQ